ncbi:hypothetical protein QM646_01040 [Rhodococcus erythropolis]|nr:hypothetical protein [Rhodococcus erythropolis]
MSPDPDLVRLHQLNYAPPPPPAKAPYSPWHLSQSLKLWARENVMRFDNAEEFLAATYAYAGILVRNFSQTAGGIALDMMDEVVERTASSCATWWWDHRQLGS